MNKTNTQVVKVAPLRMKRGGGIELTTTDDVKAVVRALIDGGLAGKHTVKSGVAAVVWGSLIGMNPVASLQYITVINGQTAVWGKGLRGRLLGSGEMGALPEYEFTGEGDSLSCKCTLKRRGVEGSVVGEFSIKDAKQAGLLAKDNWKKYPARMLQNRAFGFAAADGFSDLTGGTTTSEEAADLDPADVEVTGSRPLTPDLTVPEPKAIDEDPEVAVEALAYPEDDDDKIFKGLFEDRDGCPENEARLDE